MSENRCRRCNRKLIDPDAVYGWRCAKKLGVSTHMPSLDWLKQQKVNKAQNENPKIVGSDE